MKLSVQDSKLIEEISKMSNDFKLDYRRGNITKRECMLLIGTNNLIIQRIGRIWEINLSNYETHL
jgi:hypothetical protein